MLATGFLYALLIGIAGWIPVPSERPGAWFGFRFFHAGMALIIALYVGNVVMGIPLSKLVAIISVAAAGGAFVGIRYIHARHEWAAFCVHPVILFAVLVAAVAAARGGLSYLPYPGDEVASWLKLARQIFLVDAYWSEQVVYQHGGYPNGWPLLVAFANTAQGEWNDAHAALLPFLLHLGVLGLLFDILHDAANQTLHQGRQALATAWLGILGFLTIEASWVLVPRFLTVDEPMTYAFLGTLLTSLLAVQQDRNASRIAALAGLALAAAYLLKIAVLALVPAVLVILVGAAILSNASVRQVARDAALILVPLGLVAISWAHFKTAVECNASPLDLLNGPNPTSFDRLRFVGGLYWQALLDYAPRYKWPISIIALAGCVVAMMHRRLALIVLGVATFVAAYSAALYLSYVSCLDIIDSAELQSFQRYYLVNLRVLHVIGIVALILWALDTERVARIARDIGTAKAALPAALMIIVVLLGVQVWMAERSLRDHATRDQQDPVVRDAIVRMKTEAEQLYKVVSSRGLMQPRVSIIDQLGYGMEFDLGAYFGLKTRGDGGSNFIYRAEHPHSWNEQKLNFATVAVSRGQLVNWWRGFDVVWPIKLDLFARSALEELIGEPTCRTTPDYYFIVRSATGTFECVAKFK